MTSLIGVLVIVFLTLLWTVSFYREEEVQQKMEPVKKHNTKQV